MCFLKQLLLCRAGLACYAGLEGRRSRCGSNGAGRDPRNPGKPVENGLFVDFRDKMNGGACEITVRKRKIWRGDCRFFAFLPII